MVCSLPLHFYLLENYLEGNIQKYLQSVCLIDEIKMRKITSWKFFQLMIFLNSQKHFLMQHSFLHFTDRNKELREIKSSTQVYTETKRKIPKMNPSFLTPRAMDNAIFPLSFLLLCLSLFWICSSVTILVGENTTNYNKKRNETQNLKIIDSEIHQMRVKNRVPVLEHHTWTSGNGLVVFLKALGNYTGLVD